MEPIRNCLPKNYGDELVIVNSWIQFLNRAGSDVRYFMNYIALTNSHRQDYFLNLLYHF